MKLYKNVADIEEKLAAQTRQNGLKRAIGAHLDQIAAQRPDGKLPNGMSAEGATESIIRTAESYISARDTQQAAGTELTAEEVRASIAENLKTMTMEQAVAYLSHLKLVYRHFAVDSDNDLTEEGLKAEYQQLLAEAEGKPLPEQVDALVDSLDVERAGWFLNAVNDDSMQQETIEGTVEKLQAERATLETAAIRGAAIYGEAVNGNLEDMSPEVDPGTVTAEAAAYTDAAAVAAQVENGEITEEEGEKQLGWIGKALALALAVAWAAFLFYGGLELGLTTYSYLLLVNADKKLASLIANVVILACSYIAMGNLEDYCVAMRRAVMKMKELWNKHIGTRLSNMRTHRSVVTSSELA